MHHILEKERLTDCTTFRSTEPTLGSECCQYHINRRKSHEYIQCGGRIPTILLCPLYQLMLRKIHTMKEIPKYTQSEGGKWSGSDEHEQQQR